MGLALPLLLLFLPRVRQSANGLYFVSVLVVAGFMTNRLNVAVTGMEASAGVRYIPKWTEVAITLSIVAAGVWLFALATRHLRIFQEEPPEAVGPPLAAQAHAAD